MAGSSRTCCGASSRVSTSPADTSLSLTGLTALTGSGLFPFCQHPLSDNETSWGIDPVPERLRVLGGFDLALLWGNLGVSLLVVVAGAILVPALSLPSAFVAIVVGCLVGNLMLATAGLIGAQARVPAMTLMRAPLGTRGSYVPTVINIVQCLGWTVFELLVIATAAAALSDQLFGVEARWAWTLVFGGAALTMGLLGPIGVVRTVLRKVAIWVVPIAIAYLIWWALTAGSVSQAWNQPGEGGLSTWQGIDIVVGVTVSWVPLAADYTRFALTPRGAFWGTGIGYLLPDVLLLGLGALILLTRDVGDAAALPAAVAAGGIVALLALFVLTIAETDEAFANAYSGAVSLQNLVPAAPQRLLIVATTAVGTAGALALELTSLQSFLFLLGSFFVPLFAVLLADWLLAGRSYGAQDVFGAPAWRPGMLAAWVVGFGTYQYLSPTGPSAWIEQVQRLDPPSWGIGATLPSFVASFGVGLAAAGCRRRFRPVKTGS